MDKRLIYIGVIVAALPVVILRDFTPANELRYLSIADEALRNHALFAFTNHGVPYADKPPLYLWIVMLCRGVAGGHRVWLLSLFSLLPALGILRVMDGWTREAADDGSRRAAMTMTVTSGLFLTSALTIRMDMLMTFFIVMALREAWWIMRGTGRPGTARLLFALYTFLAVFTKGPLGLLIPLCGIAAYVFLVRKGGGRVRLFFRVWNWQVWTVVLSLCLAWFAAAYREGGADYLSDLLLHQTVGRAVNSFHHANPPYYYAVCIWYILAPWSLPVIGICVASLRKTVVKSDLQKFFMTVAATTFILLSCISSKLQVYMLPAIPFLTYPAAMLAPRFKESPWLRVAVAVTALALSLSLPALLLASAISDAPYLSDWTARVAATVLTLTGACSLHAVCKRPARALPGVTARIGTGMLVAMFVAAFAFPDINKETGYGALCDEALRESRRYGLTDFRARRIGRAQNMDVYLKRPVTVMPGDKVPRTGTGEGWVMLTKRKYADCFRGRETRVVGPYAIVVCQGSQQK